MEREREREIDNERANESGTRERGREQRTREKQRDKERTRETERHTLSNLSRYVSWEWNVASLFDLTLQRRYVGRARCWLPKERFGHANGKKDPCRNQASVLTPPPTLSSSDFPISIDLTSLKNQRTLTCTPESLGYTL